MTGSDRELRLPLTGNYVFDDRLRRLSAAAIIDGKIVGMASTMKTDYYPLPDIYPWVSCIFVSEEYRGRKISGELIAYANRYLKDNGFDRSYIPAGFFGLYEHYGYTYLKDIVNYGGGTDHLFVKRF